MNGRIPALDGVRGLGILTVVIVHLTMYANLGGIDREIFAEPVHWGWISNDLFFALSAFLITTHLLKAKGHADYYRAFYRRRALRLLPLYASVMFVCLVVFPCCGLSVTRFTGSASASPLFLTPFYNLALAFHLDWVPSALGPIWSLNVEEQFYLAWPVLAATLSRKALTRVCLALIIGSGALRATFYGAGLSPLTSYFFTFTHLDCLAGGAIAAMLFADGRRHRTFPLAAAALIGLVAIFFAQGDLGLQSPLTILCAFPLLACLFGAMLLHLVENTDGRLASLLSVRPLVWLGHYSYGIYLTHMFVFEFAGAYVNSIAMRFFAPQSVALAVANLVANFALILVLGKMTGPLQVGWKPGIFRGHERFGFGQRWSRARARVENLTIP